MLLENDQLLTPTDEVFWRQGRIEITIQLQTRLYHYKINLPLTTQSLGIYSELFSYVFYIILHKTRLIMTSMMRRNKKCFFLSLFLNWSTAEYLIKLWESYTANPYNYPQNNLLPYHWFLYNGTLVILPWTPWHSYYSMLAHQLNGLK